MTKKVGDRGVAVLLVLSFLMVLGLFALAALGHARVDTRELLRVRRDRAVQGQAREALVRLESELRGRLRTGASLRSPFLQGAVEPLPETVDVLGAEVAGAARMRTVAASVLSGASRAEVEQTLRAALPEAGGRDAIVSQLTDRLLSLPASSTQDSLSTALESVLAEAVERGDCTQRESQEALAALNPVPRLLRTRLHPDRSFGVDRTRVDWGGGPLLAGAAERYRLTVTVDDSATTGEARVFERVVAPIGRLTLRTQENWLRPTMLQPGGVVVGGVLGPELVSDSQWELGDPVLVGGDRPSGGNQHWLALAGGVLGWARDGGAWLGWHEGQPQWIESESIFGGLRTQASEASGANLSGEPIQPPLPVWGGWRGWCLPTTTGVVWTAEGVSPDQSSLREVVITGVQRVYPVGARFLVTDQQGRVRLFDGAGNLLAGPLSLGVGLGVKLPLLDRVAFPMASGVAEWQLVDSELQVTTVVAPVPTIASRSLQPDGCRGVLWFDSQERRVHWLEFRSKPREFQSPPLSGGVQDLSVHAGLGLVTAWQSDGSCSFWRRGAVRLERCGEGSASEKIGTAVPVARPTGFLLPGVTCTWRPLQPRDRKYLDWGLSLLPEMHESAGSASFVAPLVRGIEAKLATGEVVVPTGSLQHGSSVLEAADLSDLVSDGVLMSPRRGERLRYTGGPADALPSLALDGGAGSLWVKPLRAASDCPAPSQERVILRLVQRVAIRFTPNLDWLADEHPSLPTTVGIQSLVIEGAAVQRGLMTLELLRAPGDSSWRLRRELAGGAGGWLVRVLTDPTDMAPDWLVDPFAAGGTFVATSDSAEPGHWESLQWSWAPGALTLAVGAGAPETTTDNGMRFDAPVWEVVGEHWELELGGEAGDRVFDGTLQQLRIGAAGDETLDGLFEASVTPSFRWVLPRVFGAGAELLGVEAAGAWPEGTDLEWYVEEWSPAGLRTFIGRGTSWHPPSLSATRAEYVVSGRLVPREDGQAYPLLEGLEMRWLRLPELLGHVRETGAP